jgi:uncharacterized protein (TIGR02246 family)
VIKAIFAHHRPNSFLTKVREIRFLTTEVALLRAMAGMFPPGKNEINPATNAIQSLLAVKKQGKWQIEFFQNTPAQFHGRPELSEALTKELNGLLQQ